MAKHWIINYALSWGIIEIDGEPLPSGALRVDDCPMDIPVGIYRKLTDGSHIKSGDWFSTHEEAIDASKRRLENEIKLTEAILKQKKEMYFAEDGRLLPDQRGWTLFKDVVWSSRNKKKVT